MVDYLNNKVTDEIILNEEGQADFKVNAGSVSVWVLKNSSRH